MNRRDEIRGKALRELQQHHVLMVNGHFDFGNGYHGAVYLNPHQLFRHPSTIWRFAQDLLDVLPGSILEATEVVAGPVTGGALLAHTIAGLLDSRREITRPPTLFAPFSVDNTCAPRPGSGRPERESKAGHTLTRFYQQQVAGRNVLLVDDVRNTGQTLAECAAIVRNGGGIVLATAVIYDRMEAVADAGAPNIALAEYKAPENYRSEACPLCQSGVPVTTF